MPCVIAYTLPGGSKTETETERGGVTQIVHYKQKPDLLPVSHVTFDTLIHEFRLACMDARRCKTRPRLDKLDTIEREYCGVQVSEGCSIS